MLFVFPDMRVSSFWMWRTNMPLDVAFVNDEGSIVSIQSMRPCEAEKPVDCPRYPPAAEYLSALEVSSGWFSRHDVTAGDRVRLVMDAVD